VVSAAATFAVPGSLDTPTGGYAYDRRVIAELRRAGWRIDVIDLGDGFPDPPPRIRADALAALAGLSGEGPVVIDGLALGVLPEAVAALAGKRPAVALVHHPLALETGLSDARADALRASERAALAGVSRVIVTSGTTADLLVGGYGVDRARIGVAPPGTDRAPRARGSAGAAVNLLAVGALVPRKGYDILLAALARLHRLEWRLTVVGDAARSPPTAKALADQVRELGLAERITFAGAVGADALAERYAAADLFVLASRFEGYGMAFAEALVRGLPVIATSTGAIPATVPPGTGLLVPADDVAALADALALAIADEPRRRQWGEAAWAAGHAFPTWEASAQSIADTLRAVR
jgi:glycosyltransferase involved in cell wall biosynthesis